MVSKLNYLLTLYEYALCSGPNPPALIRSQSQQIIYKSLEIMDFIKNPVTIYLVIIIIPKLYNEVCPVVSFVSFEVIIQYTFSCYKILFSLHLYYLQLLCLCFSVTAITFIQNVRKYCL